MDWIAGMQRALDYIEAHLTEEIDFEQVAAESFSRVKREAALPYSSILPVDSGVLMARNRAFSTPEGKAGSSTWK